MFFKWFAYPLTKFVLAAGLFLLGPVRIFHKRNVPLEGGLLVVSNHLSDCDPAVLGHALPRPAAYMAKKELFGIPILSWIIRVLQAFPVNRGAPDRAAIRKTVELLQSGMAVVMFPEGQLSETGGLQPLLPGAAMIVARSGVPVICAGLSGTPRIIPYGSVWPRPAFGGVSVTFGWPRSFAPHTPPQEILDWMLVELERLGDLDSGPPREVK
jgi:1-acyl-sn-glycerol-3-phosphate acyltransferase